jgi:hypothetical protein
VNQRFQQFKEQAEFVGDRYALPDEFAEKFADLIVQECLTIVDGLVDKQADGSWISDELYTDYNGALHLAGRQIRERFGVEL